MRPPGGPPQQHGPPPPPLRPRFPGPGALARPGGRPLTYGEYRKMRLEHEKAMMKWQQEEDNRLQQQQQQQERSAQKLAESDSPKTSESPGRNSIA